MFCMDETEKEKNKAYFELKESSRSSLEEYYYNCLIFAAFAIGAFVLYISEGISRGIFLVLDLALMFKLLKNLWNLKKTKQKENLNIEYQIKYLRNIFTFNVIIIAEAIIRHFLNLNIVIVQYLAIAVAVYASIFLVHKLWKMYIKKEHYNSIEAGEYYKVIKKQSSKHKIFVMITLFLILCLVIINFMNILPSTALIIFMTVCYAFLLFVAIDARCNLSVQHELLEKGEIFNIEVQEFFEDLDEEDEELEEDIEENIEDNFEEEKLENDYTDIFEERENTI